MIDEEVLRRYADEHQVEPVWLMIAERSAWPGASNDGLCRRRSEGAVWWDGTDWKQVGWNKDTHR